MRVSDAMLKGSRPGRQKIAEVRQLEVRSVVDSLYSDLRARLLFGELDGGSPLTEVDVAAQYGVARPTAKAAMERLVQDGLLVRELNRSIRVPLITAEVVSDLYQSRVLMEQSAVRKLALTKSVPEAARARLSEFEAYSAMADPDVASVVACDVGFHTALVDALGLERFSAYYSMLMGEVQFGMIQVQKRGLRRPQVQAVEHSEILDAIAAGDAEWAERATQIHIIGACDQLMETLRR